MDSLVGYGSDDEVDNERYRSYRMSVEGGGSGALPRRRDDDTNYDDVNMDMSEDSQGESEPELPPAEPQPHHNTRRDDRRGSADSRERDERRTRRESPRRDRDRDRREPPRRDDRHRSDRGERPERREGRRGLLGDRPDDSHESKVPALMDLKPFGGEPPPSFEQKKAHDTRDAVSPRFSERDRGERRDRDRERERDREHRHSRRSEESKPSSSASSSSSHRYAERPERRERSRSRGAAFPPPPAHASSSTERAERRSPNSEYRPSSYKVNKKLEVMEKMGLQIKTPDGQMATAQQLRARARGPAPPHPHPHPLPNYYNPTAVNTNKILDQVQKRKLLWSGKNKNESEEAAKWSGTRFAEDNDGKQVSKFMRLMGIKEPGAVKTETPEKSTDPIKKQEELFQAMQAQYEVARATTHTMRGVGLGFQRQY